VKQPFLTIYFRDDYKFVLYDNSECVMAAREAYERSSSWHIEGNSDRKRYLYAAGSYFCRPFVELVEDILADRALLGDVGERQVWASDFDSLGSKSGEKW
jgi:hypothetical protein